MTRARLTERAKRHGWVVTYSARYETWLVRGAYRIAIFDKTRYGFGQSEAYVVKA